MKLARRFSPSHRTKLSMLRTSSAKIKKPDLRTALYLLFSTYGPVLDIVALKTMKMRGQAHIVYRDIQTSTQALRALNGFEFLGLPMKVEYAKSKSHFVAKLDGTFKITRDGCCGQGFRPTPKPPAIERTTERADTPESRGQKRPRDAEEESEDDDSDVAMEEDSDDE
ncbi:unnamed protein product [Parascedosporium putredinis]|uniref:RRM domain-containing protein n=1 Tax=Parascedosporium putredinis TaxID=1442378 RepID=A0A9P1MCZ4_9PEZI|nr:unnamed protein product [Parascedosporium putredinis]CAI7997737.1 unnamed protein product [Parascedosporium putredinis]